jgi:hypothetical protein
VKVRGNLAYGHVKVLRDMGLISAEKLGRSKILRTTASFSDYFNLSQDSRFMKKQIQKIFEDLKSIQAAGKQSGAQEEVSPKHGEEEENVTQPSEPPNVTNQ